MRHSKHLEKALNDLNHLPKDVVIEDFEFLKSKGLKTASIFHFANKMKNRWDKEKVLQAFEYGKTCKTIFYDIKYYELSFNISHEEAIDLINQFKINKTTNLEGFIKRHGEEEGRKKFEKFQLSSSSSSNLMKEKLKNSNPDTWKKEWSEYCKKQSKRCWQYYLDKNLASSIEEAKKMVSKHQKLTSGVHIDYYINKGYKEEEIKDFFEIINYKKSLTKRNRKFLKEKYGDEWVAEYEKNAASYREKMENGGHWIKLSDLDDWIKYKYRVYFLTELTLFENKIDNIDKRSKEWHVDHVFSIKQGYILNIPPEIISSPVNLKVVHFSYNCSKRDKCDITVNKLYNLYNKWREENESKKNN